MSRLTVTLLGCFELTLGSGGARVLPTRKAEALLAYLAVKPGRRYSRDMLTTLLWGDREDAQARRSLRQAIYSLRKTLPDVAEALFVMHGGGIALNPEAIDADVPRFERLVREATPKALEEAATLYRGDLLHGFLLEEPGFEEWLMAERERLRELAIDGLAKLLAHQAVGSATEPGIQTALRLLALDPMQEAVHRTLMRLYARQGRRAAALRQYQLCADILRRELRADPESSSKELYRELLRARGGMQNERESVSHPSRRPVSAARRPPIALPVPEAPLIGRASELTRLRNLLRQAEEGQGHVAIVLGEAGIGKTRLLAEMAGLALEADGTVLSGRAFESEQLLAFGPWVAAIRSSGVLDESGLLESLAPAWRTHLARLFPDIGDADAPAESGKDEYLRLFEALDRLLAALSERRPILLVLEDFHWADDMSVRLLSYIGRRTSARRILVVVSAREEQFIEAVGLRRIVAELLEPGHCVELTLTPLTRDDTVALVRSLARRGGRPSAHLEEHVWRASEGNPFMAVEMVRALEQDSDPLALSALPSPERLGKLIADRLERLSGRGQHVAAVAAVIGRTFGFRLLQSASGLSEHEAAEAVEELVRRRVLRGAGEHLEFTHDQIREVAYRRLLPVTRQVRHREVADALEAMHTGRTSAHHGEARPDANGSQEVFETLAWHYTEAEAWSKAVHYLLKATHKARNRYAYRAATALCRAAIDILTGRGGSVTDIVLALETLGDIESVQGQLAQANEAYAHALRIAADEATRRRIGDKHHRPLTAVRDGVTIAYYEHGRGEPTLFLTHPVFYGLGTYQPLVDLLCHEFRIITSDPRGAGGSDSLPPIYTLCDHVEDARAVIEGASTRPVVFVGMSRAAALGIILATTYPHLVEKLVVVGTPPSVTATADSPGIEQEFWQRIVKLIEAEDYERAMPLFWAREFSESGSLELVNTFARTSLGMPKEVLKVFFTVHDPWRDIRHLLPRVRVPTLVLHGEEDRIVPVEAGRWVASQIPGAEFFAFKGCGHLPAFSAPAQFASVLRHFVRTGHAP